MSGTGTGEQQAPPAGQRTLSQAELDRIIQDRLERHEQKVRGEYADYDALKAQAAEAETLRKAHESDVERQVREAREAATKAADEQVTAGLASAQLAVRNAEIRALAVEAGFKYPEDVVNALASADGIRVGKDFKVKGADEAIKELAEKRPEWLVNGAATAPKFTGAPTRPGSPVQNRGGERLTDEQLDAIVERRKMVIGVTGSRL